MVTAEQLRSIMPGLPSRRNTEYLPFLQAAMMEFGIEASARAAAFLAQLAHESGQFQFMEEIWGPTAAQGRYEPPSSLAARLGNTEAGDGRRFKGRGPIQITGRANYRRFGGLLGIDLESDPPRAALPPVAFRIAGLFWSKKGLNELADLVTPEAFREITRRINGGFNGLEERRRFYARACTVLGVTEAPRTRGGGAVMPRGEAAEEPVFERGHEAIRSHVPEESALEPAPASRTTRRRAQAGSRKAKADGRPKPRKAAAARAGTKSPRGVKTAASRKAAGTPRTRAGTRRTAAQPGGKGRTRAAPASRRGKR